MRRHSMNATNIISLVMRSCSGNEYMYGSSIYSPANKSLLIFVTLLLFYIHVFFFSQRECISSVCFTKLQLSLIDCNGGAT